MLVCYTPRDRFTRIYLLDDGSADEDFWLAQDKDAVWASIKKECLFGDFDDIDEDYEAEEWDRWMADWENPACWTRFGNIAIDQHY